MPDEPEQPADWPTVVAPVVVYTGVIVPMELWAKIKDALVSADSILSLLHHRGIIDSENNAADVKETMDKVVAVSRNLDQRVARSAGFNPFG